MTKTAKEAVLGVFASLIRPLMRVAYEYGISASEICGVVRRTYIQSLERRLQEQKRPTTDARLALIAGLTKSEVVALRAALRAGAPHTLKMSLDQVTSALTVWHTHSEFTGAYGLPMDLDLQPIPGSPHRSFQELVKAACPEADADALLDELAAAGAVEIIDNKTVRCLSRAYVARGGAEVEQIERVGQFIEVIATNFVRNLMRSEDEPAYLERAVVSDFPLTKRGRDQFLDFAREKGQEFLTELDTFLARLTPSDTSESGQRYGVGVYFFEESNNAASISRSSGEGIHQRSDNKRVGIVEEIDVLAGVRPKR